MKNNLLLNFAFGTLCSLSLISCDKEFSSGNYSPEQNTATITGEKYNTLTENSFVNTSTEPVSTFSIDADGGSYSNMRRMVNQNQKPPVDAIRIEELINYFEFNYTGNSADNITVNGEVSDCPWTQGHKLIRIGIKGQETTFPSSNIVLLIDVSGSMHDRLPLVQTSLKKLVNRLGASDYLSIVTYAGKSETLISPTTCDNKTKITKAIDKLNSGGGTNGSSGINTAYDLAGLHFIKGANNRVILITDGDFNVGITDQNELISLIEEKREMGIFLTTIGVGMGNYNDATMESLADHGNGTYEYLDSEEQGERIFVTHFNRLFTIAKDVKVQIEFDSTMVESYRLIGYENRILQTEDFDDDEKDAGDLGMGQSVTALYEIVPKESKNPHRFFKIDFRYKKPDEDISKKIELDIFNTGKTFEESSEFMRFSASVAGFGMLLKDSKYKGDLNYDKIIGWASHANSSDKDGAKKEFIDLVYKAKNL